VEANVNRVLEEMLAAFQADRVNPGVEFQANLDPNLPVRPIDPDGLIKAVMNLLSNAVDAFDGGPGNIALTTRYDVQAKSITVLVEDNGKGIPKDKIGRIFMPFFSTKGSKGTGLGLSMTKKYIEDMGGSITVESEEGRGTRFAIQLPFLGIRPASPDLETVDARQFGGDL
jgi:signal transduction histidine kinase